MIIDAEPAILRKRTTPFLESLYVHRIDVVVVFAYFDETGTSGGKEEITAVAAYVFSKEGADQFEEGFQRDILPLLPHDAHGRRKYSISKVRALLPAAECDHVVDLLVGCITDSATFGTIVAISSKEFEQVVLQAPFLKDLVGNKYSLCLLRSIESVVQWLDEKNISGSIEYVFEDGGSHLEPARSILGRIHDSETLRERYRWDQHRFAAKGERMPWFSAPDLLAWEWQRAHLNITKPQRGERRNTLDRLLAGVPHRTEVEAWDMVVLRAMFNKFYNLTGR